MLKQNARAQLLRASRTELLLRGRTGPSLGTAVSSRVVRQQRTAPARAAWDRLGSALDGADVILGPSAGDEAESVDPANGRGIAAGGIDIDLLHRDHRPTALSQ